ncbi:EpsG-like putative glucosyltransferase [Cricetibacter osteomyelitidis]|uniref:EpsG-like putative glucosyltransferase n=1 Tax=Cricetibacter osteomyelitidis TaxID=1521931 RepID=A0A4R2T2B1_9PAST|nr:EpsG family protein [Cricetibacter osteomyelitidis]TCP95521.1 EpsG-like putative glucosyltransferase [Cricetibacter osteomyelitidis]
MIIYNILILILIVGVFLDTFNINFKNYYFIFTLFLIFLTVILRYNIGADYLSYSEIYDSIIPFSETSFEKLIDYSEQHQLEYGYVILSSIIKNITDNFEIFIFLYNIIIFYFLYLGMKPYPNKNIQLFLLVCLFYPLYLIEAHRQGMALAIFFYNIKNIISENFFKYLTFCILGSLFHKVSLITILIYPLIIKEYSKKLLLFLLVSSFLISSFSLIGRFILFLNENLNQLSFIRRVYFYYFVKHDSTHIINSIAYIHRLFWGCVILYFYKKIPFKLVNLTVLYISIFFLFSDVGILAGRISAMFLVSYICCFAILFCNLRMFFIKLSLLFLLLMYNVSIFYKDIYTRHPIYETYNYIPYRSIFEK